MRPLLTLTLCLFSFVAGGAGPLVLANLMQSEKRGAEAALLKLTAACDRRDAAYRNKGDAQDALIAEMRRGIDVRDRVIASAQTRGPAEGDTNP